MPRPRNAPERLQPRILRTTLAGVGENKRPNLGELARKTGLARNTLRALARDDWEQLSRDVIERICDAQGLGLTQLLSLEPCDFWSSFVRSKTAYLLWGPRPTPVNEYHTRDAAARASVSAYLNDQLAVSVRPADGLVDSEAILRLVRTQNCIVVGSPRSNPVTAVVLHACFRHLGQSPPVKFMFTSDRFVDGPLSYDGQDKAGIVDSDGVAVVNATWLPPATYRSRAAKGLIDAAMVAVFRQPLATDLDVRTIVVAGHSGIGTEVAANALLKEFRDLNPTSASMYSLGVLEVRYQKPYRNTEDRVPSGYRWRILQGGRRAIGPSGRQ